MLHGVHMPHYLPHPMDVHLGWLCGLAIANSSTTSRTCRFPYCVLLLTVWPYSWIIWKITLNFWGQVILSYRVTGLIMVLISQVFSALATHRCFTVCSHSDRSAVTSYCCLICSPLVAKDVGHLVWSFVISKSVGSCEHPQILNFL